MEITCGKGQRPVRVIVRRSLSCVPAALRNEQPCFLWGENRTHAGNPGMGQRVICDE